MPKVRSVLTSGEIDQTLKLFLISWNSRGLILAFDYCFLPNLYRRMDFQIRTDLTKTIHSIIKIGTMYTYIMGQNLRKKLQSN